jgi:uncharacterized protein YjbI with pentapeptide repeats
MSSVPPVGPLPPPTPDSVSPSSAAQGSSTAQTRHPSELRVVLWALIALSLAVFAGGVALTVVSGGAWPVVMGGAGVFGVLVVCAVGGYTDGWTWTGIGLQQEGVQQGKTLWDLLQLLVVPLVLSGAGLVFTVRQDETTQQANEQQRQDALLATYLDRMTDLIKDGLGRPNATSSTKWTQKIANARTVATTRRLDNTRNAILVRFLSDSNLVSLVDLSGIDLAEGADLASAHLSHARLSYAHLSRAFLQYAYLDSADLSNADLSQTRLYQANLTNANLIQANLSNARLHGAILTQANLSQANLTSAVLSSATLSSTTLFSATLSHADLSYADLSNAHLFHTVLSNARLHGATMIGVTLTGANLSYADLSHARLPAAALSQANLSHADLSQADLLQADLSRVQWRQTTCPDGTRSDRNRTSPESCLGHLKPPM